VTTTVTHVHGPTLIAGCCNLVIYDGVPVAAVLTGQTAAERIAVLLDRHGLADIPDNAAALTEGPP